MHTGISIADPLHVLEQDLLAAAIIEFRSAAVGMAGDSLSSLQGAFIFQKIRDAGSLPKSGESADRRGL